MAPKTKRTKDSSRGDVDIISDARFSDMHSAPIFKRMKAEKHKVTLDPRFAKVLTDSFQVSEGKYDKYGRKQKKTKAKDELSSFYTLGDDGEDEQQEIVDDDDDDDDSLADAEEDLEANKERSSSNKKLKPKPKQIKRQKFKPGEKLPTDEVERRLAHLNRMARGELESGSDVGDSDSDSSDEGSEGSGGSDIMLSRKEDIPVDVLPEGGETKRLAVCNLDWDHLGAVDILKLVESFVPPGGSIIRVSVYPSDYGLERIEKEEKFGPSISTNEGDGYDNESDEIDESEESEEDAELGELEGGDGGDRKKVGIVFADSDDDSDLSDAEGLPAPMFGSKRKGSATVAKGYGKTLDYDEEELRAYEIQRSKYYFGVVECADVHTSSVLYDNVNGMEWEYSSTKVDLSFIPDELDLSDRQSRESAVKVPEGYEAPEFVSSARQQSKVTCTWDEDDPTRTRELNRLNDWKGVGEEEDISHLIALDEESGSDEGGGKRDKAEMRKLMGLDGSDEDNESFNSDYFEGGSGSEEEYNFVDPAKELALKEVLEGRGKFEKEETPWEKTQRKLLEKKKEKKEARKAKLSGVPYVKQQDITATEDVSDADFFVTSDDDFKKAKKTKSVREKKDQVEEEEDDDDDDDGRNYDMRAVVRAEKMKGKKLKGARAKKEAKRLAQSGVTEFEADVKDPRFTAMLDGDSRFGLDPTSSSFKKTEGMTAILDEQRRRRSKKSEAKEKAVGKDSAGQGEGEMSSLVSSLKNRAIQVDKSKKREKKSRD